MNLRITVKEIKGTCPVYKIGDFFLLLDGYRLSSDKPVCMHGLTAIMPYYNVLRYRTGRECGLNKDKEGRNAYLQCLDPCEYTGGGTVIFEIAQEE